MNKYNALRLRILQKDKFLLLANISFPPFGFTSVLLSGNFGGLKLCLEASECLRLLYDRACPLLGQS